MKKFVLFLAAILSASTAIAQEENLDVKYGAELLKSGTTAPSIIIEKKNDKKKDIIESNKGKYVLLDFWASWCGDCRREMKYLRRIQRTYGEAKAVKIIGFSFDKDKEAWKKCREDSALAWKNYMSEEQMRNSPVAKDYHLNWIPTFYLIDPEGKIVLSTVVMDKVFAKLKEIAPEVGEDKYPLESLEMPEADKDKKDKKAKGDKKEKKKKKE